MGVCVWVRAQQGPHRARSPGAARRPVGPLPVPPSRACGASAVCVPVVAAAPLLRRAVAWLGLAGPAWGVGRHVHLAQAVVSASSDERAWAR